MKLCETRENMDMGMGMDRYGIARSICSLLSSAYMRVKHLKLPDGTPKSRLPRLSGHDRAQSTHLEPVSESGAALQVPKQGEKSKSGRRKDLAEKVETTAISGQD